MYDIECNKNKIINGCFDTVNEKWKLIKEINELYAVSSLGRIMSMRDGRIMKTVVRSGYENAILTNELKQQKSFLVHRLVAKAFIPNPNNYPIINHKDVNPLNNNVDNLEWCSFLYNNIYDEANKKRGDKLKGRIAHNKYKSSGKNKNKILYMYSLNNELQKDYSSIGECAKYLSNAFNKEYKTVYYMIWRVTKGERKSYLGYRFVYE